MQAPQVFFSVELDCLQTPDDSPTAIDVWLSDDGTFTDKILSNVLGEDQLVLTFPEAQLARYIRISLAQGTDRWWAIDELRVKR
jgi:hypothetical protein